VGARFFSQFARAGDGDILRTALQKETVYWIKGALRTALLSLGGSTPTKPATGSEYPSDQDDFDRSIRSEARATTTRQLLHELEPLVGLIKYFAIQEVPTFATSKLKSHLDKLDRLLDVLGRLSRAADPVRIAEFSIPDLVDDIVDENADSTINVAKSGPRPLQAHGDRDLIALALANGLRNAMEAVAELPRDDPNRRVVVSWGQTDRRYWIAVIDWGLGLPHGFQRAFDIGTSTKKGDHFGMGLALAQQAIDSLGGDITLDPLDEERGTRFFFNWDLAAATES